MMICAAQLRGEQKRPLLQSDVHFLSTGLGARLEPGQSLQQVSGGGARPTATEKGPTIFEEFGVLLLAGFAVFGIWPHYGLAAVFRGLGVLLAPAHRG